MPEPPAPPPAPDLAAIEARAAAATPEPWEWGLDPVIEPGYHTQACVYIGTHPRHRDATIIAEVDYDRQVDADFIANARTDVPALVAYARALEAENARLRAGLVEMRGLSMHGEWCWSESVRVDIDRLLRGETLPGQEL